MMCNKAHLYLQIEDIRGFNNTFEEIADLIKLHNLWHDPTIPQQCHLLGRAHKIKNDNDKAREMFTMAVNAHRELPEEKRNDLNLVVYLSDLAICFLIDKEIKPAERAIIWAVNILHRLNVGRGKHLKGVIELMICLTDIKGETETRDKLKETLENLNQ
jgi:hypothetical protein